MFVVPSLDEGPCGDNLSDQASKLVKVNDTTEVLSLDEARAMTRRELPGFFIGRRREQRQFRQDVSDMRVGFVRRVLTPWLGLVVIYSEHERLRVDAGLTISALHTATSAGRKKSPFVVVQLVMFRPRA